MKLASRIFRRDDWVRTSPFGWRIHPITGDRIFHYGEDYGTNREKWNQYALENGVVVDAGYNNVRGNYVDIKYVQLGIMTSQRHLDKLNVKKGDKVGPYTIVGTTGTTGSSTGIHLHLGVKSLKTGQWIDPNTYDYGVTGIWDEYFTKDLQKYFGTTVDGILSGQRIIHRYVKRIHYGVFGSQLIRVMQKWLGIVVNGQLDKRTIVALQKRYGTIEDGIISQNSQLVRAMKEHLSKGAL